MNASVLVGSLTADRRAVQSRSIGVLKSCEPSAATRPGGWHLDSAHGQNGSVTTALLCLLPFTMARGLVSYDLTDEHNETLLRCPLLRSGSSQSTAASFASIRLLRVGSAAVASSNSASSADSSAETQHAYPS